MTDAFGLALAILASLSGIAALVFFLMLRQLRQEPEIRAYPAFLGGYSSLILGLTVTRYLIKTGLVVLNGETAIITYTSVTLGVSGLLGRGLLVFFAAFTGKAREKQRNLTTGVGSWILPGISVLLAALLWAVYLRVPGEHLAWLIPAVVIAGMLPIASSIAISLGWLFRHLRVALPGSRLPGVFFLLFFLLNVGVVGIELAFFDPVSIPGGSLSLPLSYLLWNLCTFAWAVRRYASPPALARVGGAVSGIGSVPVDPATMDRLEFSPREREIILLLAKGFANKRIAAELGISANTARNYLAAIYRKAAAGSRVELLARLQPGNSTNVPSAPCGESTNIPL